MNEFIIVFAVFINCIFAASCRLYCYILFVLSVQQFSKSEVEHWFISSHFTCHVNGRSAELVWQECLNRYFDKSHPDSVSSKHLESTGVRAVGVNSA